VHVHVLVCPCACQRLCVSASGKMCCILFWALALINSECLPITRATASEMQCDPLANDRSRKYSLFI